MFMNLNVIGADGKVTGQVKDSETREPVEYASVALYRADDGSLLNGKVTTRTGGFEFGKLASGRYFIEIQFIGYEKKKLEEFTIGDRQNLQLGEIPIRISSVVVDEIAVHGVRADVLNKLEKQTYKAGQFESAKGGSAVDVLKNMPSVSVNGLGEISVRGSAGFLLLLNGKPVLTDAQSVLSQLPANTIEDVELITSPSAKYDPDGNAGIINIKTKTGNSDEIGFVINLQQGLPSTRDFGNDRNPNRYGADATFNYQKKKWDITIGANYTRNDLAGYRIGDVRISNPDAQTVNYFPSEGERSFYRYNYAGNASVSFQADEKNLISVGFYSGKRYQERDANIFYNNSQVDENTGDVIYEFNYYNANNQIKQGTFTLGSIDYKHTFSKKSSLTFSGLYEYDDLYGNTHNHNLTEPGGTEIQYVQNPYQKPVEGYRFLVDYAVELGSGKLETGYQFRYDTQEGVFDYLISPEVPDQPNLDQFSGTADSKNQINSAYLQYSAKTDRIEYMAGLRFEQYDRTVELSTDPETHRLSLSNLFPSANVQYTLSENWKLKAGYSRRIQRSSNNQLNPIPEREHSETLEIGDPDLKPELIDALEMGVTHNFKTGMLFSTVYYRASKDPMQRVNSVYADSILNRVYTNVDKATALGLELGANLHPVKWWNLYLGANVYQQKYEGEVNVLGEIIQLDSHNDWVYSLNANTNFTLTSSLSLQANLNYLSKRPTAQGEDSRFLSPNLSVKKTFFNNRLTAGVQWQNIDLGMNESNRQEITTWGDSFYTTTNYIYETDVIMVNLSFNINRKSNGKQLKSEFGENEF